MMHVIYHEGSEGGGAGLEIQGRGDGRGRRSILSRDFD